MLFVAIGGFPYGRSCVLHETCIYDMSLGIVPYPTFGRDSIKSFVRSLSQVFTPKQINLSCGNVLKYNQFTILRVRCVYYALILFSAVG